MQGQDIYQLRGKHSAPLDTRGKEKSSAVLGISNEIFEIDIS